MRVKIKPSRYLLLVGLVMLMSSCQEWDRMSPPAGNQRHPPPEPPVMDPAFANVSDPTIGKQNYYYIISSNATLDGIEYQEGLMVRRSVDLVNMTMTEGREYILSGVVDGWATNRLRQLNPALDEASVRIGQPDLVRVGNVWRLYYSVSDGSNASVIGFAQTPSLDNPEWVDKGEVLFSDMQSGFRAISPSVVVSPDGSQHFMAFGNSREGVFVVSLDPVTGISSGVPARVASRADGSVVGNPDLFFHEGFYHILFTVSGNLPLTGHMYSTNPVGPYTDFAGRAMVGIPNFWLMTRVLTNLQHVGGIQWQGVNGVDVFNDNGRFFTSHHAVAAGASQPVLHIRETRWQNDPRRLRGRGVPVPAISPLRFGGVVDQPVTRVDVTGNWFYGTIWGHILTGINDPKSFNADGTYEGGTWNFDESTGVLQMHSTEWGGEYIYINLFKGLDIDNDGALTIIGAGVNDTFGDFPGVWIRKQGAVEGGDGEAGRPGVFDPAMAKGTNRYWIFSSNAALDGFQYQRGLVVRSSTDLVFVESEGYVLSNVIDSWAGARLRALDATIEDGDILIAQPSIRWTGNEWRLYYSVHANGNAAVIGFASSPTLDNAVWTDRGEVLYSNDASPFRAQSPSLCVAGQRHFLAFGEGRQGIFVTELDPATGRPIGTPARALTSSDPNVHVGAAEMVYHEGHYTLIGTYNQVSVLQSASVNPLGPFIDYGNRNLSGAAAFGESRVLTPYQFAGGAAWSYTNGISITRDGNNWFAVHSARRLDEAENVLHIRKMEWLNDPRMRASLGRQPFPAIMPERFSGVETGIVRLSDIPGVWDYGTLWYQPGVAGVNNMSAPVMELFADGTYLHVGQTVGGLWNFNEATGVLHLLSSAWGNENIFIQVNPVFNWDTNVNTFAGAGVNDTFFFHPGVWMRKR